MERREALRQQLAQQPLEDTVEQMLGLEAQLRQQQEQLQQREEELRRKEEQLAEAQAFVEELQRQLFGSRAEKLSAREKSQVDEIVRDLEDQQRRPDAVSKQVLKDEREAQRQRHAARHPLLPIKLETETTILEPEVRSCPCCGPLVRIGQEVTEEMDWVPAKLIRRRIIRPKYAACGCGRVGMIIAPLPPRLIPQSKLGLNLAVYILLARYDDHLSFYWLEQIFRERHGVEIPRQQMVHWVEQIASLFLPLYEAMWAEMMAGGYVQIDETPVKVLDPEVKGKAAQGYLWFFAVPGQDVILEFSRSRGQAVPRQRLQGFHGTIQSDAYEVYEALERKDSTLHRIGCLAHARRRFYQALQQCFADDALWFIAQIRQLYRIEDETRLLAPANRYEIRQAQAPAIWDAMKEKAEQLQPKLLPQSTLGKAVNYFLNEYQPLRGYLEDGRFEIDNNLVENDIRPTAVGRKRWLFVGHPDAGWRSAVIYSLLISARRRCLNPQIYLTDILARLPSIKITKIDQLLPGHWKPSSTNIS